MKLATDSADRLLNPPEHCLERMVERIVAEADPETVILFGSRATGEARRDSDFDFLVVEAEPFSAGRSRWQEATRLYLALRGYGAAKDILLYSRDEFEALKGSPTHVVGRAVREGRVVYERH